MKRRKNLKHIETDLGIVNIFTKLQNVEGCDVESIEIIPDRFIGNELVDLEVSINKKLYKLDYLKIRLIRERSKLK